ncbi:transcriptional regulator [Vibrio harveyi]|nr:transcriptional regulator [Vibrio harveyi]
MRMALAKDPLLRQLKIIQLLPKLPGRIATSTLIERLLESGYEASERTIQRDLNKLSSLFPIVVNDTSKPYRWSLDVGFACSTPSTETVTALALTLAEPVLMQQLPSSAFSLISRETNRSKKLLSALQQNELSRWQDKIRVVPDGLQYAPQYINADIWEALTTSLLKDTQVSVKYYSRKKSEERELVLSPLGIVNKSRHSYLVAVAHGYTAPTIYALRRFRQAIVLQSPAVIPDGFNLDDYIQSGALSWSQPNEVQQELVANISSDLAFSLQENIINDSQEITTIEGTSEQYRLRVKVPNNKETLWWIFSLNNEITVLSPIELKNQIVSCLESQLSRYHAIENQNIGISDDL